jgi:hypothetical protein
VTIIVEGNIKRERVRKVVVARIGVRIIQQRYTGDQIPWAHLQGEYGAGETVRRGGKGGRRESKCK